jgi:hypothetical protein
VPLGPGDVALGDRRGVAVAARERALDGVARRVVPGLEEGRVGGK